jgi:hypothetical protein
MTFTSLQILKSICENSRKYKLIIIPCNDPCLCVISTTQKFPDIISEDDTVALTW